MLSPECSPLQPLDWPAPAHVRAGWTTRQGGVSAAPYHSLNLGLHVGDDPRAVQENRARLRRLLPAEPVWLNQVHGVELHHAQGPTAAPVTADGSWTDQPSVVCAVMTADCLPVLLCDRAGTRVAAVHAGWRGLAAGVIESTVAELRRQAPMITGVDTHGPKYAELGVASVTFHIEASTNPLSLIRDIRTRGSKVAAAVKPSTPVAELAELMPELDMVLVMTVEPGFGGQKLIESTIAKVTQAREISRSKGLEIAIQVDGGVTEENIAILARAGADTFVAGSSVFKAVDRNKQIDLLRTLAQQAARG